MVFATLAAIVDPLGFDVDDRSSGAGTLEQRTAALSDLFCVVGGCEMLLRCVLSLDELLFCESLLFSESGCIAERSGLVLGEVLHFTSDLCPKGPTSAFESFELSSLARDLTLEGIGGL